MCIDFIDLNTACPKNPYPLPDINRLIEGSSGYRVLCFMDAYSVYNQINMDPLDAPKTTFMSNQGNYYYNVLPSGLKNVGVTYHKINNAVFDFQIGKNLEVYIDDMIIKMEEGNNHSNDLEDILQSVRKYDMCLNPAKCSYEVQAGKFMRFMLTTRGVESNLGKFQLIINMRIPINVKGVQHVTGRQVALYCFLSYADNKAFMFFTALRKNEKFEWTNKCEEALNKIK